LSKKILILGNMANDGYAVAKELIKMNVDVTLAVNNSGYAYSFPEWEEERFNYFFDPHKTKRNEIISNWNVPNWIVNIDFIPSLRPHLLKNTVKNFYNIIKLCKKFDIIEAHVPFSIQCQFTGKPYVSYDAGWIRKLFSEKKTIGVSFGKRGYKKAKNIIITNPDTFSIVKNNPKIFNKKTVFIPFAIDPDHYKPSSKVLPESPFKPNNDELTIFCPSRHHWGLKGHNKMINAFARFVKTFPNTRLITASWGDDILYSIALINQLKISDKVTWIAPIPKQRLIEYYNYADIVLDQYNLGSWGTSTPEAMSCEKPVLIYYNKYIKQCFGSEPPIPSVKTENEIHELLLKLADRQFRTEMGKKCREWIIKTHNPQLVAKKHMEVLE